MSDAEVVTAGFEDPPLSRFRGLNGSNIYMSFRGLPSIYAKDLASVIFRVLLLQDGLDGRPKGTYGLVHFEEIRAFFSDHGMRYTLNHAHAMTYFIENGYLVRQGRSEIFLLGVVFVELCDQSVPMPDAAPAA